jgi:fructose-1,6-bisphosphatase II / sedoheptulose-1,7-bisphosphatase
MGIIDLTKKYELNEIIKGDSIFCATGITSSEVLAGIKIDKEICISESLVTHKNSSFRKIIKNITTIKE